MSPVAISAFARHGGISEAAALEYLEACDSVVTLPGGAIVLKGDVVHICARQGGLSGRALVSAVRSALEGFHSIKAILKCPIRHDNSRAMVFAMHFGFKPYRATETHQWLFRNSGDALP